MCVVCRFQLESDYARRGIAPVAMLIFGMFLGVGAYATTLKFSKQESLGRVADVASVASETVKEIIEPLQDEPILEINLNTRAVSKPKTIKKESSSKKIEDQNKRVSSSVEIIPPTALNNRKPETSSTKSESPSAHIVKEKEVPICAFTSFGNPSHAVLINEVAWMGTDNNATDEWIELRNNSGQQIILSGWQLLDEDGGIVIRFGSADVLSMMNLFLMERSDDDVIVEVRANKIYSGSLSNKGEWLKLFDERCNLIDEVNGLPSWGKIGGSSSAHKTLERNIFDFGWHTSVSEGGTPGNQNSVVLVETTTPPVSNGPPSLVQVVNQEQSPDLPSSTLLPVSLFISEIFYDAEGSDTGKEFIEVCNTGESVNLSDVALYNGDDSLVAFGSKPEDIVVVGANRCILVGLSNYVGMPIADVKRSATLPNNMATITLREESGNVLDTFSYSEGSVVSGQSLARSSKDSSPLAGVPTPRNTNNE